MLATLCDDVRFVHCRVHNDMLKIPNLSRKRAGFLTRQQPKPWRFSYEYDNGKPVTEWDLSGVWVGECVSE